MTIMTTIRDRPKRGRPRSLKPLRPFDPSDHDSLGANSHQPKVQAVIGDAIRRGEVRVRPVPGCPGRVEVVPVTPPRPAGPGAGIR